MGSESVGRGTCISGLFYCSVVKAGQGIVGDEEEATSQSQVKVGVGVGV